MSENVATPERDPFDAGLAIRAVGLLREFGEARVLAAADVHVSLGLARLAGEVDEVVALAAALAVRGPRVGHVFVDLESVRETTAVESEELIDLSELPWPEPGDWLARVGASALVAAGEETVLADRPLRLVGSHLYLDRYWHEERQVAADLLARSSGSEPAVDHELLAAGITRLFPGGASDELQRMAAAAAVLRRLSVVAGGPGTGKTTTVARIVALLTEQAAAAGLPAPVVALAAPTAKAAARLEEAVREQARAIDVDARTREHVLGLGASTLHRLLGWRPDSNSRFRHNRQNPLPHDVVIVDETSMVSLSMMARVVEAVSASARLILLGDPGQLTSIEAGAVLGDVVGPAANGLLMRPPARSQIASVVGREVPAADPPDGIAIGDGVVVLEHVHRYGAGIAALAQAIRRGDSQGAIEVLSGGAEGVSWIGVEPAEVDSESELAPVIDGAVSAARPVIDAARAGEAEKALEALGAFRLLCAHRRGPHGVATWTSRIEAWLAERVDAFDPVDWAYAGRPLLVTENDYELQLFNGDTGVIVQTAPDTLRAVFDRGGKLLHFSPSRLGSVDTVYAMTIHKSQGSQFGTAVVLLPPPTSRILTRELLYTAVTRAREQLIVVGTEETVRAAVQRPVARASGLRGRLWGV